MPKPAVYLRVSSEMQREKQSIKSQEDALNVWLATQALTPDDVLWYRDDGISGKTPIMERGDGARLIGDVKAGKVAGFVAVFSISRISRETSDFFAFRSMLRDYNVALMGVSENIDTRLEGGDFIAGIHALLADEAQRNLRKASMSGLHRRAREGKWIARAPYGYRINDGGYLEAFEPFAGIAKDIYRLYLAGKGAHQIADHLNTLGIPSPGGSKWQTNIILRILHNPAYKGKGRWNVAEMKIGRRTGRKRPEGEHITIPCPALVSPAEWERAQRELAHAAKRFERTGKAAQGCLLNRLYCLDCGRRYYRAVTRSGAFYYRHDEYHDKTCQSENVPAMLADDEVWRVVAKAIRNPSLWLSEMAAKRDSAEARAQIARDLAQLDKAIERNAQALANLEEMTLYGNMSVDRYAVRSKELSEQQQTLEARRAALASRLDSDHARAEQERSLAAEMQAWQGMIDNPVFEQKQRIVDALLDAVHVARHGKAVQVEPAFK